MTATLFILFIYLSFAWETDNFTCRHQNLQDSSTVMSAEVNRRIQVLLANGTPTHQKASHIPLQQRVHDSGFQSLNENERLTVETTVRLMMADRGLTDFDEAVRIWSAHPGQATPLRGCDRSELLMSLRGAIASPFMGTIGGWAEDNPAVSSCRPNGIGAYTGFSPIYGPALSIVGLSPTIRIGDTFLGTDKIEHFLAEGYMYYEKQLQGGTQNEILDIGNVEENTIFGLAVAGIKSHGDLAANYSGYQFWRNVVDGSNPYFRCTNGRWQQVRQFNWNDYVTPAWDEAINCSSYANDTTTQFMNRRASEIQSQNGQPARSCPVTPSLCEHAQSWISDPIARTQIIHPSCLSLSRQTSTESLTPASLAQ